MILSPSRDWFCKWTEKALAGLDSVVKLVDNILIPAPPRDERYCQIRSVLNRCCLHGITISKKLEVEQSVKFASHIVDSTGVHPTANKVATIKDFQHPYDVPFLRSFMGMCNQLMSLMPDLSHAMRVMKRCSRSHALGTGPPILRRSSRS